MSWSPIASLSKRSTRQFMHLNPERPFAQSLSMTTEGRLTNGVDKRCLVCRSVGWGGEQCCTPQPCSGPEGWVNRTGIADCYGHAPAGHHSIFHSVAAQLAGQTLHP